MYIGNEKTIRFGQFFQSNCKRKSVRAHDTIQNAIGAEFQSRGYEVVYEWKDVDEDSSYRYDLIAQNKKELNVVEVKDIIDIRNFGQIEAYCLQVKKENPKAKVWLGTDCMNYDNLVQGEVGQMLERLIKNENLGVILINPQLVWMLPTHEDLIHLQEKGHICEDCSYCNGFQINGVGRKILEAIETGSKKMPKIAESDFDEWFEFSTEQFKEIKKEFLDIKKKVGTKEFETTTGLRIEK